MRARAVMRRVPLGGGIGWSMVISVGRGIVRDGGAAHRYSRATMESEPPPLVLDLRGLKCPLPTLRTGKALRNLPDGARIVVTCTDPLAGIDLPNLCQQTGDILERQSLADGIFTFHIRRRSATITVSVASTAP
jgi:tRNA 2-thiouridine synthesizing protein A